MATDVAGRGIDIQDVSMVVNYDMAKNIEGESACLCFATSGGLFGRVPLPSFVCLFVWFVNMYVCLFVLLYLRATKMPQTVSLLIQFLMVTRKCKWLNGLQKLAGSRSVLTTEPVFIILMKFFFINESKMVMKYTNFINDAESYGETS